MKAAIVIPALNEAEAIAEVVGGVRDYGVPVVVDDGSNDDTAGRAAAAGAEVVRHASRRGYDGALASGFARAHELGAEVIVTIDGDGQLDPEAIPRALAPIAAGRATLVLGRRPRAARIAEVLFNLYARVRFGAPDILCGLKAFRADAYAGHRARMGDGGVHTGLALALLRQKEPFATVEVAVRPRAGASRFGGRWRANMTILRALLRALADDLLRR